MFYIIEKKNVLSFFWNQIYTEKPFSQCSHPPYNTALFRITDVENWGEMYRKWWIRYLVGESLEMKAEAILVHRLSRCTDLQYLSVYDCVKWLFLPCVLKIEKIPCFRVLSFLQSYVFTINLSTGIVYMYHKHPGHFEIVLVILNISVISWRSVLLVEETGVPRENHRPATSHWQTLSHNVVFCTPRHERDSNSQL
jgi:hypothetical protein